MFIYRTLVVGLVENTFLFILHNISFGLLYIHRPQPHGLIRGSYAIIPHVCVIHNLSVDGVHLRIAFGCLLIIAFLIFTLRLKLKLAILFPLFGLSGEPNCADNKQEEKDDLFHG